jgi:GTP-binding protein EngB required for normal cell division
MGTLNPNQIRHVVSTFTYVDSLLQAVERVTSAGSSPFASERPDVATDEARMAQSFVRLARDRMLAALDRLAIPRPTRGLSARWSAETSLKFAESSLADLTGERLRGYGEVDESAALELAALAADVGGVLHRARQLFHEGDAGGLTAVLANMPGAVGEILREVDRVSREHAIADVRPLLTAAAERAGSGTYDVGVFGRVSAGKSSLINALVGEAVLPVGATPVTAVPTRLTRGERGAVVHFLDGEPRVIPLADIAEYATEERNPANRAGVRAIEVTAPSVPEGLRLLDTPGVGSLGTSGPALAFQWLPRCDLGLVLIAAASAVARDDLALVTGLHQAGIRALVLVSKADLLPEDGVNEAIAYVHRELTSAVGPDTTLEVRAVSTAVGTGRQLDALRDDVLAPLARDHAREARRALLLRLRRLLQSTAAALSGRSLDVGEAVLAIQRSRARAMDLVRQEVDRTDSAVSSILEDAAKAAEAAWQHGKDARSAVRSTIIRSAVNSLGALTGAVDSVRAAAGATAETRRIPPLFDPDFLDALPSLPPPQLAKRLIGHAVAVRRLEPIAQPLSEALQRYATRLYAWSMGALEELANASWDATVADPNRALPPRLEHLARMLDALELEESFDAGSVSLAAPGEAR